MSLTLIVGALLLVSYVVFAIYAARGGNLMLGFFFMAVLWAGLGTIAGVTTWSASAAQVKAGMIDINNGIFEQGPELWGATAAIIIFGSWFGRVLVDTGIARSIIRTAVELGGERPAITCILLSLVTGLIFSSAYGVGSVIAIGVIVFPIMLALGISPALGTSAFLMSVGSGLYLNGGWLAQVGALIPQFDQTQHAWKLFGFLGFGLGMLACFAMILLITSFSKTKRAWPAQVPSDQKRVGALAMITPLIPVALSIFFNVKPITALLIAVIWAILTTGNYKKWHEMTALLQRTFHDGVADVALVFAFLFFLQMFLRSAKVCAPLLSPILQPLMPGSLLPVFVGFGLLSVLALFRGPLTMWGAGAATLALFQSIGGIFTPQVLFPLFMVPTTTVNGSICPTQSWCLWAIGYMKAGLKEYFKCCLAFALVTAFLLEMIAYFLFAV